MLKKISAILDKMADHLETSGLLHEAFQLDCVSDMLEKTAGAGLHPMGSGTPISTEGTTSITSKERNIFQKVIGKENYYGSLSAITDQVMKALEQAGITPRTGNESWGGTFSGALSEGDHAKINLDLLKGGKEVTNSKLILNIYKMDGVQKTTYELNTYLS